MRKTLVLVTVAALAFAHPEAADSAEATSVQSGWWTASPLPAPDVPADGLLVQGGPDQDSPYAYAAVSASLPAGSTAVQLTLTIAPGAATTPASTVALCPLAGSFSLASGGPADEGPAFDCDRMLTADPSDDGTTYDFDLRDLAATGELAVAILPTAPTDRVVFRAPTTSSIKTEASGTEADQPAEDDASKAFADVGSSINGNFTFDSGTAGLSSSGSATFEVPPINPPSVPEVAGDRGPASSGAIQTSLSSATDRDDGPKVASLLFLALVALAMGLWLLAGQGTLRDDALES